MNIVGSFFRGGRSTVTNARGDALGICQPGASFLQGDRATLTFCTFHTPLTPVHLHRLEFSVYIINIPLSVGVFLNVAVALWGPAD